jgi:hypothetical protein
VPECAKLFKAENFWRKHVEKRHAEWFENIQRDVSLNALSVMPGANPTTIALPRQHLCLGSSPHLAVAIRREQQRTLPTWFWSGP